MRLIQGEYFGHAYGTFCKCGFHMRKRQDGSLFCERVACQEKAKEMKK